VNQLQLPSSQAVCSDMRKDKPEASKRRNTISDNISPEIKEAMEKLASASENNMSAGKAFPSTGHRKNSRSEMQSRPKKLPFKHTATGDTSTEKNAAKKGSPRSEPAAGPSLPKDPNGIGRGSRDASAIQKTTRLKMDLNRAIVPPGAITPNHQDSHRLHWFRTRPHEE
jgi:hypothetical protein